MRLTTIACISFFAASVIPGVALAGENFSFNGGLGYSKAVNDGFPDGGIGVHAGIVYKAQPAIGVGLEAGYLGLGTSSVTMSGSGYTATSDISISEIPVTAICQYSFSPGNRVEPFLLGGAGLYMSRVSADVTSSEGDESFAMSGSSTESDFGFNVGTGIKVGSPEQSVRFGGDARFHMVMTEVESTKMINVMARVYFN